MKVQRISSDLSSEELKKMKKILLNKKYKKIYTYHIEDASGTVCAFDLGNGKRKPMRLFLQKDGTFSTSAGYSRKKFKTKFFAKLKMRKYMNCVLVKHILYHSIEKDFEDFTEDLWVID